MARLFPLSAAVVIWVLSCSVATAQSTSSADFAAKTVFRVDAPTRSGSAVLLESGTDGHLFVTCYHVVQGANEFQLYDRSDRIVFSSDKVTVEAFGAPDYDLAFLRIKGDLDGVPATALAEKKDRPTRALAVGYPFYDRSLLESVPVTVITDEKGPRTRTAQSLGVMRGNSELKFQLLRQEPTAKGMSGGLVVDHEGQFIGLVFGRLENTVGLSIPASQVSEVLAKALKEKQFKPFPKEEAFALVQPFTAVATRHFSDDAAVYESSLSFRSFEHWNELFADASQFHSEFQEVSLDLADITKPSGDAAREPRQLALRLDAATFRNADDKLKVWINGYEETISKSDFDKAVATRKSRTLDLSQHLRSGENLVILSKETAKEPGLRLNRLDESNEINIWVDVEGVPQYHLVRSLPAVVQNYAVYLTVQHGEEDVLQSEQGERNANLRVALRSDVVATIFNGAPLKRELSIGDSLAGSFVEGEIQVVRPEKEISWADYQPLVQEGDFSPTGFVALRRHTDQTMDLSTLGFGRVEQARLSLQGINLKVPGQDLQFLLQSRVQAVRTKDGYVVVPRSVSGRLARRQDGHRFELPLFGDSGITVDIGAVIQEALLSWVNNDILHPSAPQSLSKRTLDEFYRSTRIDRLSPTAKVSLSRMMIRPGKQSDWIIFTFAVDGGGEGHLQADDLVPVDESIGCEIFARDVPANIVEVMRPLLGDEAEKRLPRDVFEATRLSAFRLGAVPPITPPDAPPPRDADRAVDWVNASFIRWLDAAEKRVDLSVASLKAADLTLKDVRLVASVVAASSQSEPAKLASGTLEIKEAHIKDHQRLSDLKIEYDVYHGKESDPFVLQFNSVDAAILFNELKVSTSPKESRGCITLTNGAPLGVDVTATLTEGLGKLQLQSEGKRVFVNANLELVKVKVVQEGIAKALMGKLGNEGGATLERLTVDTKAGIADGRLKVRYRETKIIKIDEVKAFGKVVIPKTEKTVVLLDIEKDFDINYDATADKAEASFKIGDIQVTLPDLQKHIDLKKLLGEALGR